MQPVPSPTPLLAYYADDFTGATDALESLALAGVRTELYPEPPSRTELQDAGWPQAVGVAGRTRSLPTGAIEAELRPGLEALRDLSPRHVHYKVCSTFDSSPEVGSIGRAIDIGADVFGARLVPVVAAAPALGRWCVFGNLFARMGIGSDGAIYRLDRHPAMTHHPITPATEADLVRRLQEQTQRRVALVNILHTQGPPGALIPELQRALAEGAQVALIDMLSERESLSIGRALDTLATPPSPCFVVGSSAVGAALAAGWAADGAVTPVATPPRATPNGPVLVVSGSCSPVTAVQLEQAFQAGFLSVPLDTPSLAAEGEGLAVASAVRSAAAALAAGQSVAVHASLGQDDPRIAATLRSLADGGAAGGASSRIGGALGAVARGCLESSPVRRVVVAGGDTSSYALRALGVRSLRFAATLSPGAPVCAARAPGSPADGVELVVKGGQVGKPDFLLSSRDA